jgi:hypothetical protein
MKDISYFFNTLEISDISLLGYSFKNERVKDEIISKISHVEIQEIDSSFSFRSYLRNEKLNHLFEEGNLPNSNAKWFVLDINNITSKSLIDRAKLIKTTLEGIRSDMYSEYSESYPQKPFYKLLVTCPIQRTSSDFVYEKNPSFIDGSSPIYMSDFACSINDNNTLNVIKNRQWRDLTDDDYESGRGPEKISLGGLKDYTYICNYENCQ